MKELSVTLKRHNAPDWEFSWDSEIGDSMTLKAVNIDQCFDKFSDLFSPKIVGDVNGQEVKLARLEGTGGCERPAFAAGVAQLAVEEGRLKIKLRE